MLDTGSEGEGKTVPSLHPVDSRLRGNDGGSGDGAARGRHTGFKAVSTGRGMIQDVATLMMVTVAEIHFPNSSCQVLRFCISMVKSF